MNCSPRCAGTMVGSPLPTWECGLWSAGSMGGVLVHAVNSRPNQSKAHLDCQDAQEPEGGGSGVDIQFPAGASAAGRDAGR